MCAILQLVSAPFTCCLPGLSCRSRSTVCWTELFSENCSELQGSTMFWLNIFNRTQDGGWNDSQLTSLDFRSRIHEFPATFALFYVMHESNPRVPIPPVKFPTMRALSLVKYSPPKGFLRGQMPAPPPTWSDKIQIDFPKREQVFYESCNFCTSFTYSKTYKNTHNTVIAVHGIDVALLLRSKATAASLIMSSIQRLWRPLGPGHG